MPRTYKKRLGSRAYRSYNEKMLNRAVTEVVEGRLSIRQASEHYGIPYGTLFNKYHGKYGKNLELKHEEIRILESAAKSAEWGFPLSLLDLRMFAKMLLDKQGRSVAKFTNNLPGVDWAYSLLKRHNSGYSQRVATNIKKSRAAVSRESLTQYFDNLEEVIKDVPPANIFNYDETNMSDDPGKKIGLYKRGVKYPEKAMNFSKSSTTVMVPMWFGRWRSSAPVHYLQKDWFTTSFLPHAKRLPGRKVLIGDNLSSHLDEEVLRQCSENEIDFVCLVPNSTHLTQPLDVAFFRPMKTAWRQILTNWKIQNPWLSTVPKDTFLYLLTKALKRMDEAKPKPNSITSGIKRNMMSAFYATGIHPFNKNKVLDRLPRESLDENEVESTLTNFLKDSRYGNSSNEPARKKKRLDVAPGKSIATHNANVAISSPQPGTSNENVHRIRRTTPPVDSVLVSGAVANSSPDDDAEELGWAARAE
ncbi:hypothetical protein MSG28_013591, partial [Choristoneura fumiferana]